MVAVQNTRAHKSRAAAFGMWLILLVSIASTSAHADFGLSVTIAPPGLPVYEQPPIPAPGWIWTPGYWAYGPEGYFWVPGTWVEPPEAGLLWTPGYWGWGNGFYVWNAGFWAPVVGFYGGVNYGYGYFGRGYEGGYWRGNQFYYNRTVNNVSNVQITNVYNRTVVNNITENRVSYAGGPGGVQARPTPEEEQAAHVRHVPPTPQQSQHHQRASSQRELLASVNQGKPPIAATARPTDFSTHVVPAKRAAAPMPTEAARTTAVQNGEPARGAQMAGRTPTPPAPVHASDLPRYEAPAALGASASSAERETARQQSELQARHEQERAALAQQQERDHANARQQQINAQATASLERQHQQQTQQLQERHGTEQRSIAPPPPPPHAAAAQPPPPPHGAGPHEPPH